MSEDEKEKYISKLIKDMLGKLPRAGETHKSGGVGERRPKRKADPTLPLEDRIAELAEPPAKQHQKEDKTRRKDAGVKLSLLDFFGEFEGLVECRLGQNTRRIVRTALELAKKASPNSPVLSTSLLLGMVHAGRRAGIGTTKKFIFERVRETERDVLDSHLAAAKRSREVLGAKLEGRLGVTDYVEGTMKRAKEIAQNTTGDETIEVRHLFAGLLVYTQKGRETGAHRRLREMGVDIEGIKGEFIGFLEQAGLEDDMAAWSRILKGEDVIDSGAVTDSEADVGASIGGSSVSDQPAKIDALGFEPYTTAIAKFLSNEDTKPPLTMSVEGEWGSGKSSFMMQLEGKLEAEGGLIVKFSPWRHDKEDGVWAAFVLTFIDQLSAKLRWAKATRADLKLLRERFDWKAGWPEVVKFCAKVSMYMLAPFVVIAILIVGELPYVKDIGAGSKAFWGVISVLVCWSAGVFKGLKWVKDVAGNPFENDLKM